MRKSLHLGVSNTALIAAVAPIVFAFAPLGSTFAHAQKTQPQAIARGSALMQFRGPASRHSTATAAAPGNRTPGAGTGAYLGTSAYDINKYNVIAGWDQDDNGVYHGFLRTP